MRRHQKKGLPHRSELKITAHKVGQQHHEIHIVYKWNEGLQVIKSLFTS
jgi:hypothetical protein